jgi:hypothetical protein
VDVQTLADLRKVHYAASYDAWLAAHRS